MYIVQLYIVKNNIFFSLVFDCLMNKTNILKQIRGFFCRPSRSTFFFNYEKIVWTIWKYHKQNINKLIRFFIIFINMFFVNFQIVTRWFSKMPKRNRADSQYKKHIPLKVQLYSKTKQTNTYTCHFIGLP